MVDSNKRSREDEGEDDISKKPKTLQMSSEELDNVQIGEVLGEGAYGSVRAGIYKSEDVAVKFIYHNAGGNSKKTFEEFKMAVEKEIRLYEVASSTTCAVPKIKGYYFSKEGEAMDFDGKDVNFNYIIILEKIIGESLDFNIRAGGHSREQKIEWIRQLKEGIQCLHNNRMLHRDIKPANIMVRDSDKTIVLIDFGLSCHSEKADLLCDDKIYAGSPMYMSAIKNYIIKTGHRVRISDEIVSDKWAIGICALQILTEKGNDYYEAITGQLFMKEFDGNSREYPNLMTMAMNYFYFMANEIYKEDAEMITILQNGIFKELLKPGLHL